MILPRLVPLLILSAAAAAADSTVAPQAKSSLTPEGSTSDNVATAILHKLNSMFSTAESSALCGVCKDALNIAKGISEFNRGEILSKVLGGLCGNPKFANSKGCKIPHDTAMAEGGHSGFINDAGNVLSLMDPYSDDGDLFCYNFVFQSCPKPATPEIDLSDWWPPKPDDAVEPKTSGETFNVLHISDIHYQKDYLVGSAANCNDMMCCMASSKWTAIGREWVSAPNMGYYKCDSPDSLIRSSMSDMTDGRFEYEFALFTGDMVDHNPLFISYEESIDEEEASLKYMKDYLGHIPVYPVLGNHDTYPFAQVAQDASGYSNLFTWNSDLMSHLWEDYGWIDGDAAQMVKEHYGGFALTTRHGLRVISINSNFYYTWNLYNYWNTSTPDLSGVFRFLANELLECEKNGQRAWIITHVPPNGDDTMDLPANVFTQIVERFSPHVIAAVFFGHTHQDEFQLIYQSSDSSTVVSEDDKTAESALMTAWISQSITPLTNYNPGWRYYEVDSKTFSIMDSHNFYSRLNDSFPENLDSLDWEPLYSARDAYNPGWPKDAPLNATYWHEVAQGIKDDPDIAQGYMENGYRASPYTPDCRDDECRIQNYCYVSSFNPQQFKECMDSHS